MTKYILSFSTYDMTKYTLHIRVTLLTLLDYWYPTLENQLPLDLLNSPYYLPYIYP